MTINPSVWDRCERDFSCTSHALPCGRTRWTEWFGLGYALWSAIFCCLLCLNVGFVLSSDDPAAVPSGHPFHVAYSAFILHSSLSLVMQVLAVAAQALAFVCADCDGALRGIEGRSSAKIGSRRVAFAMASFAVVFVIAKGILLVSFCEGMATSRARGAPDNDLAALMAALLMLSGDTVMVSLVLLATWW